MSTKEALRYSEDKYQMLLDGIEDHAIFMMDSRGKVLSWNAGAERIKGYTAQEIIGHSFSCFFPPEEIKRGRPEEVLRLTAASGRHEEQGMRVRKDGSRFLAHVTFTALHDLAGYLRGFSEFSHDLSESKESEARYRGLLEAAPDAMVVINVDGDIVLLNLRAEKQFGYRRDELVGQQVKNIIPEGFAERLVSDGTRSAADAIAQQIGSGIELSGRRKDGSRFPIEIMLSPLDSAEGVLVTAAIRDISVRKAADAHLAQMEGRYRGLLEAAPDAMLVVNPDLEIVLLNAQTERQFGYRRDELVGQTVTNVIPEGFAERLIADAGRSTDDAQAQQIGAGIIVVVATDAPLSPDQLKRLARRVPLGLGRPGAIEMNGSGDIFLAFSTANRGADDGNSGEDSGMLHPVESQGLQRLASWNMDPLFTAVTQAMEEAVDNALIAAKTMTGPNYWVVTALPQDQLREILRNHNLLRQ